MRGVSAQWPGDVPSGLAELIAAVREVSSVPRLFGALDGRPLRQREKPRKRAQVDAFTAALRSFQQAIDGGDRGWTERIVDVGSGHGHLTRELAEQLSVPAVGLERDDARVARARGLASSAPPAFVVRDVFREGLTLEARDCAVGLHACGELGDLMVQSAVAVNASVGLVACCMQKRRETMRRPLCADHAFGSALDLPREILGLSNLTSGEVGVEASRVENLLGRERRIALRHLLAEAGIACRHGAELEGLNRRSGHLALEELVARAFAVRSLPLPSRAAIEDAARWARKAHTRMRRHALPRSMLARPLEVFVLLDRARHLAMRGHPVSIGELFPVEVSARNLALFAGHAPVS